MNALRRRLEADNSADEGLSLVEIVVAMMIFALISTGLLYSMISVLSVNRDSRTRQVAANLAAEEVDRARDVENILDIVPWSTASGTADPQDDSRPVGPVTLNGDVFHIERRVQWESDTTSAQPCGANATGSTLRYKSVNVFVTWNGMAPGAEPVTTGTLINPRETINDPSKGTILVSVLTNGSLGAQGVSISSNPALTATTTDSNGCAYLFRVAPGTYTLTLSKAGYVDNFNDPTPDTVVTVAAGKVSNYEFRYDVGVKYNLNYSNNFWLATNLQISAIDTNRTFLDAADGSLLLHPTGAGYTIVAGDAATCPASNPSNWESSADGLRQVDEPPLYPSQLGTPDTTVPIPMGLVQVDNLRSDEYIRAISANGVDHPSCLTSMTLNFPRNKDRIALPYGSWRLVEVEPDGDIDPIPFTEIRGASSTNLFTGAITIDPRVAP